MLEADSNDNGTFRIVDSVDVNKVGSGAALRGNSSGELCTVNVENSIHTYPCDQNV